MMSQIQISLQGGDAIAIAQAFQGLPGFEGEVILEKASDDEMLRGEKIDRALLIITTTAAIVGILGDGAGLVKEWKGDGGDQKVNSVLITSDDGKSVELKNATPEQILEVLKGL